MVSFFQIGWGGREEAVSRHALPCVVTVAEYGMGIFVVSLPRDRLVDSLVNRLVDILSADMLCCVCAHSRWMKLHSLAAGWRSHGTLHTRIIRGFCVRLCCHMG